MKDTLNTTGYSKEDEYFYKQNKELIEKRRVELDQKKKAQESQEMKKDHWMKCPKCGSQMSEIDMSGISVDRCSGCKGTFFDHGELDILFSAKEQSTFLDKLKKAFG